MATKRKASANVTGAAKSGRASATSTPGPSTPREIGNDSDSDDEPGTPVEPETEQDKQSAEELKKAVNRFSLAAYQDTVKRGLIDDASRFFSKGKRDFSYLPLKPDFKSRPIWIDPLRGHIILENFNPLAEQAKDFLITIAEPQSRPTFLHEYSLTTHSLYAAVSVGLLPQDIVNTLERFSKTPLPQSIIGFIQSCASSYGKVKLVIKDTKYFVESNDPEVLQKLLKDPIIGPCRVQGTETVSSAPSMGGLVIPGTSNAAGVLQAQLQQGENQQTENTEKAQPENPFDALREDDDDDNQEAVHAFEIPDSSVEIVQKRCLEIQYPMLEEYDFRNDDRNANLEIDLRPSTQIRSYQEKSLSKMFGNGRAKSGIIVLPCGAGKTLVGITAACTIKKGCIVLCTSTMSAHQWRQEFLKWSNIRAEDIAVFTADSKSKFPGNTGIIVTTYPMVTQSGKRAYDSQKMMDFLTGREWGLMLLDEVHVVPANIFRKVSHSIKSHAKLGLTATLLREDDKIQDLNFLIGPKLFEANWMELSEQGHIAKVQCAEVWCPMTTEFMDKYLDKNIDRTLKQNLYVMNPRKIQACQFLIDYHERRGDKIIVFSDNVYALEFIARALVKPFICGQTPNRERMDVLDNFMLNPAMRTVFLSKIGDTSLDLPEATCLIQISSHYGSRRQEAQRLGRILRAKRRSDEGFNAFFYSLVSKDTVEMYYSTKRQAFLVDQGYSFKVITQLAGMEKMEGLAYREPQERRELLQKLMVDAARHEDRMDDNTDDLFDKASKRKRRVKRTAGTLGELSGGQDMAYIEQRKNANKALKKKPQNAFFKKIAREKQRLKEQQ